MSKKKFLVMILALGTILAFGAVLGANGAETELCGCLEDTGAATAEWDSTQVNTETETAMGAYSVKLNAGHAAGDWAEVQLCPTPAGITLDDMATITTGWSWWYYIVAAGFTGGHRGTSLELYFQSATDPDGFAEMTIMYKAYGAQPWNPAPTGAWTEQTIVSATTTGITYGSTEAGVGFGPLPAVNEGTIAAMVTAIIALDANAGNWVLTKVRPALGWIGAKEVTAYVDDIQIDGTVYDLEPCYFLEPDIAMNVKTTKATFTVVDCCGVELGAKSGNSFVDNWYATKGEGVGEVEVVAGGNTDIPDASEHNYITVLMVTTGDCIITCDVDYPGTPDGKEVTLHAEKKWGEIDETDLTAWSLDEDGEPCEQRPVGAEIEIPRSGIDVNQKVLVQEKVIANFLPGPMPAPAGGAKITWWLLENDAEDEAQTALEELLERFDSYDYVTGGLGWGHGCGRYGTSAGDPTFIPETIIDGIYAAHPALNTEFILEECDSVTGTATKTVTETDHAGDPLGLGEGFTNTTVEFSDVGTGTVEPVIVVVLADYPIDKNGQNAVCVEYFKFTPKPEYKDVQTLVVDVITDGVIDPIRKMLYVFVRDYNGTPANPEAVEFIIDGPYGLFEELLADTDLFPDPCGYPGCYPGPYPSGISPDSKYAVSTTRLGKASEKVAGHFDGVETGTGDDIPPGTSPLDMVYSPNFSSGAKCDSSVDDGYAIAGVQIISSFKKPVDILIKIHDCYGCEEVIIIRDVMVTFGAPDSATRTYYSVGVGGWYMVSTPLDLVDPHTVTTVYDELPGVILYQWVPNNTPPDYGDYAERNGGYVLDSKWGWWLYLAGDTTITVEGTDPALPDTTNFVAADFAANGWYQVSAPYTSVWDDIATAGIEENLAGNARLVSYDPETATYHEHYVGDGYVLSPWYSYWVNVENELTAEFDLEKADPSDMPSPLSMMSAQRIPAGLEMPPAPPSFVPQGAIPEVNVELATVDGVVTFAASAGEALKVQVFNLSGGLVYEASADGSELTWAMQTAAGELVANGIYLAKVGVKTAAGWVNGGLFQILVLR